MCKADHFGQSKIVNILDNYVSNEFNKVDSVSILSKQHGSTIMNHNSGS